MALRVSVALHVVAEEVVLLGLVAVGKQSLAALVAAVHLAMVAIVVIIVMAVIVVANNKLKRVQGQTPLHFLCAKKRQKTQKIGIYIAVIA